MPLPRRDSNTEGAAIPALTTRLIGHILPRAGAASSAPIRSQSKVAAAADHASAAAAATFSTSQPATVATTVAATLQGTPSTSS